MAKIYASRVRERVSTSGLVDFTLDGAIPGAKAFSDRMSNGDICEYLAITPSKLQWETGIGTFNSGVLERTTVNESTNSDAKVDFTISPQVMIAITGAAYPPESGGSFAEIITTGGESEVHFDGIFDGSTDSYRIDIMRLKFSTNNAQLRGQCRRSGGDVAPAAYLFTGNFFNGSGATTLQDGAPGDIRFTDFNIQDSSDTSASLSMIMHVHRSSGAQDVADIEHILYRTTSSAMWCRYHGGLIMSATGGQMDGIKFYPSSGTFDAGGIFRVYRVPN